MNEIFTRLINLPTTIHGYTVMDTNGDFNIFINSRINHEAMLKTYKHELKHIKQGDFHRTVSADMIEIYAHN